VAENHRFRSFTLFGWLVADGWCWFVLREEYCWLVAGGWFDVREKYSWLVADKPSEQGPYLSTDRAYTNIKRKKSSASTRSESIASAAAPSSAPSLATIQQVCAGRAPAAPPPLAPVASSSPSLLLLTWTPRPPPRRLPWPRPHLRRRPLRGRRR
jgi:hypothetical protein